MQTRNVYSLPVNRESIEKTIAEGSPAHRGDLVNALDFIVPEGVPVLAAADGVVVAIKDDSDIGGPDRRYWCDGNYVTIEHEGGEFSEYEHLRYKGVTVSIGQRVERGETIGYSGNTGYSSRPHLHFVVYKIAGSEEEDFESLEIRFEKSSKTNSKT